MTEKSDVLIRGKRLSLDKLCQNALHAVGKDGSSEICCDEDVSLYLENVNFKSDGKLNGRYLGKIDSSLVDSYRQIVYSKDKKVWLDSSGVQFNTSKMIAVNNEFKVSIMIEVGGLYEI